MPGWDVLFKRTLMAFFVLEKNLFNLVAGVCLHGFGFHIRWVYGLFQKSDWEMYRLFTAHQTFTGDFDLVLGRS